jgi:hypothetical protein
MIISVYADGSWRVAKNMDYAVDATFPDFVASGEIDETHSEIIEAEFEGDAAGAIEESLARGFALGLLAASGIETEGHDRADGHGAEHESPAPKGDAQP